MSAVIPRFRLTMPDTWFGGTRSARERALIDSSNGCMKSLLRISPGCTGASLIFRSAIASSVIVSQFDLVRVALFPSEANAVLVIHAYAELASACALQRLD